jgi:hypothetical protein
MTLPVREALSPSRSARPRSTPAMTNDRGLRRPLRARRISRRRPVARPDLTAPAAPCYPLSCGPSSAKLRPGYPLRCSPDSAGKDSYQLSAVGTSGMDHRSGNTDIYGRRRRIKLKPTTHALRGARLSLPTRAPQRGELRGLLSTRPARGTIAAAQPTTISSAQRNEVSSAAAPIAGGPSRKPT